jgi:hypothetical protein
LKPECKAIDRHANPGISATKKLERLKSFFNFCTNSGYAPLVTPTRNGIRSAAHALRNRTSPGLGASQALTGAIAASPPRSFAFDG